VKGEEQIIRVGFPETEEFYLEVDFKPVKV